MSDKVTKTEFEKMLERKAAKEAAREKTVEPGPDVVGSEQEPATGQNDAQEETAGEDELTRVQEALAAQQAECDTLKDQLLRARADFDNYRKRILREMEQVRQTASSNLIRALLPALDNLERALAHADADDGFAEGVRMVHKQVQDTFAAEGLIAIPAKGEVFDPVVHDALAAAPSETVAEGVVIEEYERGYKLRDSVLRPAKVIVSSGPDTPGETGDAETPESEQESKEE